MPSVSPDAAALPDGADTVLERAVGDADVHPDTRTATAAAAAVTQRPTSDRNTATTPPPDPCDI
ncbi:hypothetical protein GCM10011594_41670 [Nakamurella endophytica]|uniref:Uncharacterized protein n=1 Tax=Nakamurella endophytica TaxID=1748367 RepID=A0A917WNK3_9ACTN|nr:hypothetical protein GCM10011594_41670 [Nakamurella endophytica]